MCDFIYANVRKAANCFSTLNGANKLQDAVAAHAQFLMPYYK